MTEVLTQNTEDLIIQNLDQQIIKAFDLVLTEAFIDQINLIEDMLQSITSWISLAFNR